MMFLIIDIFSSSPRGESEGGEGKLSGGGSGRVDYGKGVVLLLAQHPRRELVFGVFSLKCS